MVVGRGASWTMYELDASVGLSATLLAALAVALIVCLTAAAGTLVLCRRQRDKWSE